MPDWPLPGAPMDNGIVGPRFGLLDVRAVVENTSHGFDVVAAVVNYSSR